jgi:aspartate-semialdehyde dehydrogenase
MPMRQSFRPACMQGERLESRVLLNGSQGTVGSPVLLQGLHAPAHIFHSRKSAAVSSLVDLAFQSFQQDFRQVRATYIASVQNQTASSADKTAFENYIQQRTNLLAQQVTNSLLVYPQSTTRSNRSDSALPLIIVRINGAMDTRNAAPRQNSGTLLKNLMQTTPDVNASTTSIAIDTIAQDNAIESFRVATLNGVSIVRNGYFGSAQNKQ